MNDIWAVIASGPSLTAEDCEKTIALKTVAVNTSWKMARHAQFIFAGDFAWWKNYGEEIDIPAEKWSTSDQAKIVFGVNKLSSIQTATNSGLNAIRLAIKKGAKKIILLGFDCSIKRGLHWHGAHTHKREHNPDEKKCSKWIKEFSSFDFGDAEIINCSLDSEIKVFQKMGIDDALRYFKKSDC